MHKSSSDPAFAVAGAEFALVGANGVVATATTDAAGVASFPPIDPVATPGPYMVRELTAPPGLLASPTTYPCRRRATTQPIRRSSRSSTNRRAAAVQVRKVLSEPIDAPDLTGFVFTVRRSDGGFDDEIVTGSRRAHRRDRA